MNNNKQDKLPYKSLMTCDFATLKNTIQFRLTTNDR